MWKSAWKKRKTRNFSPAQRHGNSRSCPIASGAAAPGTHLAASSWRETTRGRCSGGRHEAAASRLPTTSPPRLPRPRWTQSGDPQSATGSRTACTPSTRNTERCGCEQRVSLLRESRSNHLGRKKKIRERKWAGLECRFRRRKRGKKNFDHSANDTSALR